MIECVHFYGENDIKDEYCYLLKYCINRNLDEKRNNFMISWCIKAPTANVVIVILYKTCTFHCYSNSKEMYMYICEASLQKGTDAAPKIEIFFYINRAGHDKSVKFF